MDSESNGICLDCDEPIAPKRLAAVPDALYCIRCQPRHDKKIKEIEPIDIETLRELAENVWQMKMAS